MGREDRDARRSHLADLGAHELQYQIEIVNHEIEDHSHVGAARLEGCQALGLQEPRLLKVGRGCSDRAIESLHMPDLEKQPAFPGRLHQLLGTGQRIGEGFLDQGVQPPLEDRQRHFDMRRRGHHDGDRLDTIQQRLERGEGGRFEFLGDVRGPRGIVVVEAHELGARDFLEEPDVVKAERACPYDTHPHGSDGRAALHTITPRCEASMKRRNVSTSGTCGSSVRARATPWLTVRSELNTSR